MKICPTCLLEFEKRTKYCSQKCYFSAPKSEETKAKMSAASKGKPKSISMREALSKATTGKPKVHLRGKANPNYDGKYSSDPEVHERFLEAVSARGQAWDDEQRKAHSLRMLGDCNVMRGKEHTPEFKLRMSEVKKRRYRDGIVKVSLSKISKAEKEIAEFFIENKWDIKQQFHIPGVPYWYDFYLPSHNLIIEYQGDYWHANPNKYSSGTFIRILKRGPVLVDDIWARDEQKREAAIQAGYKVAYIWESEYKKLGLETVIEFL